MLRLLLAMIVGAGLPFASAQQLPSAEPGVAAPEGSSVERFGDSMVVNGRPMAINHVTTASPPAAALRHYRKALDQITGGRVIESKVAGDLILASRVGEEFVTVRVRSTPAGSSDV